MEAEVQEDFRCYHVQRVGIEVGLLYLAHNFGEGLAPLPVDFAGVGSLGGGVSGGVGCQFRVEIGLEGVRNAQQSAVGIRPYLNLLVKVKNSASEAGMKSLLIDTPFFKLRRWFYRPWLLSYRPGL